MDEDIFQCVYKFLSNSKFGDISCNLGVTQLPFWVHAQGLLKILTFQKILARICWIWEPKIFAYIIMVAVWKFLAASPRPRQL